MNPIRPPLLLFAQAIDHCLALKVELCQPSERPCQALKLFCQLAQDPPQLLQLLSTEPIQTALADESVIQYASQADNWSCSDCPLGIKDQCNVLHFFLNLRNSYQELTFFRGQIFTPEIICEFLQAWQGVNLLPFLPPVSVLVTP
ncbi:MAG: hypothetical protein GC158_06010 [Cyanobacteria bacterium RI_101]|nr:hypothetical protein [Cyanobacteria bacterium RI_101]